MTDLGPRLKASLDDVSQDVDVAPPDPGPLLAKAVARRHTKIVSLAGLAATVALGLVALVAVAPSPRTTRVATESPTSTTSTPLINSVTPSIVEDVPPITSTGSVTTTSPRPSPTTTMREPQTSTAVAPSPCTYRGEVGYPSSPLSISMASDRSVWATFATDGLSTSTDGGLSWTYRCPAANRTFLNRIFAFDRKRAITFAAGFSEPGSDSNWTLLHTEDGGESWPRASGFEGLEARFFTDIDFVDNTNGWLAGSFRGINTPPAAPLLFRTKDGGRSWTQIALPKEVGLEAVAVSFVDVLNGWMATHFGGQGLYRTDDGGGTWTPVDLPDGFEQVGNVLANGDRVYVVARVSRPNGTGGTRIGASSDNGSTWTVTEMGAGDLGDLALARANRVIAAGGDGFDGASGMARVVVSDDGGKTWSDAVVPAVRGGIASLTVAGEEVWATGMGGLMRSEDAGRHWVAQTVPAS